MPDFTYEAITATGQRSKGTLTANTERDAAAQLDAKGLFPVRIHAPRGGAAITARGGSRIKVKPRDMATFYSQLADLLHSGVPLLRSLDILDRQGSSPKLSMVLKDVRGRVADGTSLADGMGAHPRAFNELAVSMVRAGQEGGFLEDVLKRIATFTEQQEDLKSKVVGALAYPIFLAVVGTCILGVLIMFFVPQFEPMFDDLRARGELPGLTIALLAFSRFLINWFIPIVIGVVVLVVVFWRWSGTEHGRLRLDRVRLKLPQAGKIYLNLALARFTRILGTLLHNGIPILQALKIAKDSTGNRVLTLAIEEAAENVTGGKSLAAPFANCKYLPRDIVEMVAIGEESNSLETVLVNIADSLEKRTTRQLELFVRLLEPMMLLFMAMVTLIVVLALLLPIFNLGKTINR
jgi:general secretion pathway protein F/type IV pilus assembly protein PilC